VHAACPFVWPDLRLGLPPYLQANLCEAHHRIRRLRFHSDGKVGGSGGSKKSSADAVAAAALAASSEEYVASKVEETRRSAIRKDRRERPADAFALLIKKGHSPSDIRAALSVQRIDFVVTAHPTQATRRTLLIKYREMAKLLAKNDRADLQSDERARVREALTRVIVSSWETHTIRRARPTPVEEARAGFAVVEDVLWTAVPDHLRSLDKALVPSTSCHRRLFPCR
jgi:phosphoenolpyruvate carboxylase